MNKPLSILDSSFKYTPSSKTDITKTFARIRKELKNSTTNQESKEPLVADGYKSLNKPLVSPTLNPNGFVLSAQWFEME